MAGRKTTMSKSQFEKLLNGLNAYRKQHPKGWPSMTYVSEDGFELGYGLMKIVYSRFANKKPLREEENTELKEIGYLDEADRLADLFNEATTLYMRGFPVSIKRPRELRPLVSKYGVVCSIKITEKQSRENAEKIKYPDHTYAKVKYIEKVDALKAIKALNGKKEGERVWIVTDFCDRKA